MTTNWAKNDRHPLANRCLASVALVALALPTFARGQSPVPSEGLAALQSAEAALVELIRNAEPAVVAITRLPPEQPGRARLPFGPRDRGIFQDLRGVASGMPLAPSGAGVVIDEAGLILTQYLVVKSGERHRVTTVDGETYDAEIRAADPRSGLAVLAVEEAEFRPIEIGRAELLAKGSTVIAVGNPHAVLSDGQPTASVGKVTNTAAKAGPQANLNNARDSQNNYRTTLHHFGALIQTDAKLGWNAGGGAVIGLDGKLVGITTTVSVIAGHEQPAGYAIPLNETFRRVVEALKEGREAEYGFLGISFNPTRSQSGEPGIAVGQAFPGGPAGRAGLRMHDVITAIDGSAVTNADKLQLLVGRQPPGSSVQVTFERSAATQQADVVLGKYYQPGQKIVTTPAKTWRGIRVDYSTAVPARLLQQAAAQGLLDPEGCVAVAEVIPDSVSWEQNVRAGMFISHVSGKRVTSPDEFWQAVEQSDSAVNLRFTSPHVPPGQPEQDAAPRGIPRR